jgi:hypothetical protein
VERLRGRRAVLREVDWDGLPVDVVAAVAESARVEPLPVPRLALGGIELEGRTPLRELIEWVDERSPRWRLRVVDGDGRVEARRGRLALVGDFEVDDHRLRLRLRVARLGPLGLPAPGRPALSRTLDLPELPHAMSILDARVRPPFVEFRATIPSLTI